MTKAEKLTVQGSVTKEESMCEIYIYSGGGVQKHFADCKTEQEALDFCEAYNYEWTGQ